MGKGKPKSIAPDNLRSDDQMEVVLGLCEGEIEGFYSATLTYDGLDSLMLNDTSYASAVSSAFTPRDQQGVPNVVLAEAGTGVGKTLGYLAPATVWAEKNSGPVWISTYTRQLQQQIDKELDRLHPDPAVKAKRVVVRKGRENYLCLLNLEDAANIAHTQPAYANAIGLMARWAAATRDGDMAGGDFPGWTGVLTLFL